MERNNLKVINGVPTTDRLMTGMDQHIASTDGSIVVDSLRKHAYSNILKISLEKKTESFQIKILIFFIFLFKT